jgi:hypothetical protein
MEKAKLLYNFGRHPVASTATMMSSKGIDLGHIADIPIKLQYSCFALVGVEVAAVMWQYNEPVVSLLMFLLYGPILMGTILIVSDKCLSVVLDESVGPV